MLLLLVLLAAPTFSVTPSTISNAATWTDWSATIELRVSSDGGKVKRMDLALRADAEGQQLRLDWQAPANMRGMKFLARAPKSGDDSWSMYLRPLRRVVPVPLHAANTYVRDMMNLGFFKPRPEHFTFEPTTEQRTLEGTPCTVLRGAPANAAARRQFGYDRFTWCVDAAGLVRQIEFFNGDTLTRRQTVKAFTQTPGGPLATHISAVDLEDGVTTEATLLDLKVNQGLKAERFTRRTLARR